MIDFPKSRYDELHERYDRWWNHELRQPLLYVTVPDRDPGRPMPNAPLLSQATCLDFSYSPDQIMDRIDYDLSCRSYLGDSYPLVNMDLFGPGILAAFLGATADNSTGTVWFLVDQFKALDDLKFSFDPNHPIFQRIRDLYIAGMERWNGQVVMGMTDLGGTLDVLSSFRGSENLLMDLYDAPEKVKQLTKQIQDLWFQYYEEFSALLRSVNPGYSDWSTLLSTTPSYTIQCDFSYMISPQMFDEFVRDDLQDSCSRLDRSLYHLDGIGQLPHLDSLLQINNLNAVQWIPGDGQPNIEDWPQVYRKILNAKKSAQVVAGTLASAHSLIKNLGAGANLQVRTYENSRSAVESFLEVHKQR